MRFDNILIEDKVKEKILSNHNVGAREIINVLLSNPFILKTRFGRYIAVGYYQRYLTVIFDKKDKFTNIVTAYPSSESQVRLYNKKKQ